MNESDLQKLADDLLLLLRGARNKTRSEEDLVKKLKAHPSDIFTAVKILKSWGYEIGKQKAAYTFKRAPDSITATEIAYGLKTKTIGRTALSYRRVGSTNDIASQLADDKAVEGLIVTAEQQTKGRGRLGRNWHSPPGLGIYVSIVLRPNFPPEDAPGVSLMTALALADTFASYCSDAVGVKWPNDVLIAGRKAAGILTELSAERGKINHLIVGVGMNINHTSRDFPAELRTIATSLRRFLKHRLDRLDVLRLFLKNFEREYELYRKSRLRPSQKRLRKYSTLIGRRVALASGSFHIEGNCVDIDERGNLILEENGSRMMISSGEVTVVKE